MALSTGMVVHIDDNPGVRRRDFVENLLRQRRGIHGARFSKAHPHLMVVDYDPGIVTSLDILRQCLYQNLDAERIS